MQPSLITDHVFLQLCHLFLLDAVILMGALSLVLSIALFARRILCASDECHEAVSQLRRVARKQGLLTRYSAIA